VRSIKTLLVVIIVVIGSMWLHEANLANAHWCVSCIILLFSIWSITENMHSHL